MVPDALKPMASYSHVTAAEGWLSVTGQLPTDPDDDQAPLPDGIEAQTRRVIAGRRPRQGRRYCPV